MKMSTLALLMAIACLAIMCFAAVRGNIVATAQAAVATLTTLAARHIAIRIERMP